ncbi:MAG: hypothetical protein K2K53_04685, partial [Oscillospiraceae bacterium]|nr:hypothetical protein [Oscillospiraceae bacterium]
MAKTYPLFGILRGENWRILLDCLHLWLVMWSNSKCKNPNTRKYAEGKKKSAVSSRKQRILWSCYPDLNWRP